MTEADILATTYEDKVTVYRSCKMELPNKETVFLKDLEGQVIYQEIECALSSHTGGELNQSSTVAEAPVKYSLFVRPEIDIKPNDYLVISHQRRKTVAIAGRAEVLSSHCNVPLILREDEV